MLNLCSRSSVMVGPNVFASLVQVKGNLSNEAACLNRPKFSFKKETPVYSVIFWMKYLKFYQGRFNNPVSNPDRLAVYRQVDTYSIDRPTCSHSHSHLRTILESSVCLTCMGLNCGWRLEHCSSTSIHPACYRTLGSVCDILD